MQDRDCPLPRDLPMEESTMWVSAHSYGGNAAAPAADGARLALRPRTSTCRARAACRAPSSAGRKSRGRRGPLPRAFRRHHPAHGQVAPAREAHAPVGKAARRLGVLPAQLHFAVARVRHDAIVIERAHRLLRPFEQLHEIAVLIEQHAGHADAPVLFARGHQQFIERRARHAHGGAAEVNEFVDHCSQSLGR